MTFEVPTLHLTVSGISNPATAGVASSVVVTVRDEANNIFTAYRGTVHFTSTDPAAVLPANYTFTAADAGTHTFTGGVTLKTAGSRTVTATDTTDSSITGSQTVTVNAAAANHLDVTGIANPATVNVASSVVVTARDAFNNVASSYRGIIHFTSTDPAAILPANYTFTAADAGTHTFTGGVTFKTAGSRTVTATDTVTCDDHRFADRHGEPGHGVLQRHWYHQPGYGGRSVQRDRYGPRYGGQCDDGLPGDCSTSRRPTPWPGYRRTTPSRRRTPACTPSRAG